MAARVLEVVADVGAGAADQPVGGLGDDVEAVVPRLVDAVVVVIGVDAAVRVEPEALGADVGAARDGVLAAAGGAVGVGEALDVEALPLDGLALLGEAGDEAADRRLAVRLAAGDGVAGDARVGHRVLNERVVDLPPRGLRRRRAAALPHRAPAVGDVLPLVGDVHGGHGADHGEAGGAAPDLDGRLGDGVGADLAAGPAGEEAGGVPPLDLGAAGLGAVLDVGDDALAEEAVLAVAPVVAEPVCELVRARALRPLRPPGAADDLVGAAAAVGAGLDQLALLLPVGGRLGVGLGGPVAAVVALAGAPGAVAAALLALGAEPRVGRLLGGHAAGAGPRGDAAAHQAGQLSLPRDEGVLRLDEAARLLGVVDEVGRRRRGAGADGGRRRRPRRVGGSVEADHLRRVLPELDELGLPREPLADVLQLGELGLQRRVELVVRLEQGGVVAVEAGELDVGGVEADDVVDADAEGVGQHAARGGELVEELPPRVGREGDDEAERLEGETGHVLAGHDGPGAALVQVEEGEAGAGDGQRAVRQEGVAVEVDLRPARVRGCEVGRLVGRGAGAAREVDRLDVPAGEERREWRTGRLGTAGERGSI